MDSEMQDVRLRQFRIKLRVLQRTFKEKAFYEKEADQCRLKLAQMKNENFDEYAINQQEKVLNETLSIIPDCQKRLNNAYNDLKSLITISHDLSETQQYMDAQTLLNTINIT